MGITATLNPTEVIDVIVNNSVSTPVLTVSDQVIKLVIDVTPRAVTTVVENRNKTITIAEMPIGRKGDDGVGVPTGGTFGQVLAKASNDDFDTEWVTGGGGSSDVSNFELELARKSTGNSYMEFIMDVSGNVTNVDYWTNSLKSTKLFSKVITWISGNPTVVSVTDEINNKVLTTTMLYDVDDTLLSVTKEVV